MKTTLGQQKSKITEVSLPESRLITYQSPAKIRFLLQWEYMSCFLGSNFRNRGISKGNQKGHAIQLNSTRMAVITNIFEQKIQTQIKCTNQSSQGNKGEHTQNWQSHWMMVCLCSKAKTYTHTFLKGTRSAIVSQWNGQWGSYMDQTCNVTKNPTC